MQQVDRAADRFAVLLASGFGSDADIRWFCGPAGFLEVCRQVRVHAAADPSSHSGWPALLDELDDRSPVLGHQRPSQRAVALLQVAAQGTTGEPAVIAAGLLPGGHHPDAAVPLGVRATLDRLVADLEAYFAGDGDRRPGGTIPIALSRHSRGEIALFSVSPSGRPGQLPDLLEAPFQRIGASFAEALGDAAMAAANFAPFRYCVVSSRTHVPVEAVDGRSVGLGAAVLLRHLSDPAFAAPDPDWVFTGDITPEGTTRSLLTDASGRDYGTKLQALGTRTLVYPTADRREVEDIGVHADQTARLEAVATLAEAEALVTRHLAGRAAYQRALTGLSTASTAKPSRRHRATIAVAAGMALAAVIVLAVTTIRQLLDQGSLDASRQRAAGVSLSVNPAGGAPPFEMERFEVTNERYLACLSVGKCPPLTDEARPLPEDNPGLPVVGVTAAAAEAFCEFVYGSSWGLPTYEQWYAAVLTKAFASFPHGEVGHADLSLRPAEPTEVRPVSSLVDHDGEFVGLTDNVTEWSRTVCSPTGCGPVESIRANGFGRVRLLGVPFDYGLDPALLSGDGWLTDPGAPDYQLISTGSESDLGFRCAERT